MPRAVDVCAVSAGLLVAGRVLGATAVATATAAATAAAANVSSSSSSTPGNGSSTEQHASNSSAAFANSAIDDGGGIDPRDFAQGYTDVQTLMLAGVCTLIVLVFALGAGFAVRIAWRKLRERAADGYTGVVHRDDSSDPLQGGRGHSTHSSGNLLADELKAVAGQPVSTAVVDSAAIDDGSSQSPLLAGSASGGSVRSHANGSVITMTLKNNHLIVETQDRAVRMQDGATKTTTTTFTTSASPEHEPVFVVEVTQPRGYAALPACAEADNPSSSCGQQALAEDAASSQRAQVHRADAADDDEDMGARTQVDATSASAAAATEAAAAAAPRSNTGLSQSDLSVSSAGSANPSYRYGNQLGYDGGPFGYPQYAGYCVEAPPAGAVAGAAPAAAPTAEAAAATPGSARRPVFWGGQDSMLSSDQQNELLLSDILQEEMLQEEQRKLGNGHDSATLQHAGLHRTGSLPPRVRTELAQEQDKAGAGAAAGSRLDPVVEAAPPKGAYSPRKRASLPAITPNLCKQPAADRRAGGGPSPRLDRLKNDISPLREVADLSPEAEQCAGRRTLQDGVSDKTFENKAFVSSDQTAS